MKIWKWTVLLSGLLLIAAMASGAAAQNNAEGNPPALEPVPKTPITKLEAFLGRKGTLFIEDGYAAGTIKGPAGDFSGLSITAISIYLPGAENAKTKGLRCSVFRAQSRGASQDRACYLDMEEAESLSKALDYLIQLSAKWKDAKLDKGTQRWATFLTKDYLSVQLTQASAEDMAAISTTRPALWPIVGIGAISKVSIGFDSLDALTQIKATVDKALAWLKAQ